jgi:uncharacterized coiled-coil protein SlyX
MENAARIDDLKWEISYQNRVMDTSPYGSLTYAVAKMRLKQLQAELDELTKKP